LGSRSILVEVAESSAATSLIPRISALSGVKRVTGTPDGLIVEVTTDSDPRAEISRLVVDSGAKLVGLGYSRSELDEAYINAIRGPPAQ
jgi:hypothetical protein